MIRDSDIDHIWNHLVAAGFQKAEDVLTNEAHGFAAVVDSGEVSSTSLNTYVKRLRQSLFSEEDSLSLLSTFGAATTKAELRALATIRKLAPDFANKRGGRSYFQQTLRLIAESILNGLKGQDVRLILEEAGIKVSKTHLRNLHITGRLTANHISIGGHRRYKPGEICAFINQYGEPSIRSGYLEQLILFSDGPFRLDGTQIAIRRLFWRNSISRYKPTTPEELELWLKSAVTARNIRYLAVPLDQVGAVPKNLIQVLNNLNITLLAIP